MSVRPKRGPVRWVIALLACLTAGCADVEPPPEHGAPTTGVDREILGFSLTETHAGHKAWRIDAEKAYRIPNDPIVSLEEVRLVFYDKNGAVDSRLTSGRGEVNEDTGDLTARYRVVMTSVRGDTLTTEQLTYNKETELISGDEYVRLAKPDRVLTGLGFESTPDLSQYKVHKNVRVTLIDRGAADAPGP